MAIKPVLKCLVISAIVFLASSNIAYAAQTQTLGNLITNIYSSFSKFPNLLSSFSYTFGILLAITGVFKFKDHVDNPGQNPLSSGIKRFIAGGMLFSGPYMLSVVSGTIHGGGGSAISESGRSGAVTGGGPDQMIYDLMADIYGPINAMITVFVYISAIILLINGVSRLIKTAQDGPRGPTGFGTIMTFLVAGVLISFGDSLGSFTSSLFGTTTVSTHAVISSSLLDTDSAKRVQSVIEAVMAFIMIVGYISFIRGWFVLKSFADGNSQASIAQSLTFLFGGTLAINLGEFINMLQASLGINTGGTISFA